MSRSLLRAQRRLAVGSLLLTAVVAVTVGARAAGPARTLSIEILPPGEIVIQGDPAIDIALDQQLVVIAHDDDGNDRDVTRDARLVLDDASLASIDGPALLTARNTGSTTLTLSYVDLHGTTIQAMRKLTVDASKGRAGASSTPVRLTLSPSSWKPTAATIADPAQQQFVAMMEFADGTHADVTRTLGLLACEPGTDDASALADVLDGGLVSAGALGRFDVFADAGNGVTARVSVIPGTPAGTPKAAAKLAPASTAAASGATASGATAAAAVAAYSGEPLKSSTNLIDVAAYQTLKAKGIEPAPLCSSLEFLRRVTADIAGRLPTEAEIENLKVAPSRAATINRLLASPDYARHWGRDILAAWLCMPVRVASQDGVIFEPEPMLVNIVKNDMKLADLVQVLAQSPERTNGPTPTGIGRAFGEEYVAGYQKADRLLETFAGTSSKCARCHDHPFTSTRDNPRWTEMQNYGLYAFFSGNGRATLLARDGKPLLDKNGDPIRAVPAFVLDGATNPPTPPLYTASLASRKAAFGDLLAASNQFHRATAHRIWAELANKLLDPNQFLRANVDAVKAPLVLDALTKVFKSKQTSMKEFIRYCVSSRLYQLSTKGTTTKNDPFLARHTVRRLQGSVLDAGIDTIAGQPITPDRFFESGFGCFSDRVSITQRTDATNMLQPLILMNSTSGTRRLTAKVVALAADVDAKKITMPMAVKSLYRQLLGRDPSATELPLVLDKVKTLTTRVALEDVAVALATSVEFVGR